jgi:tagatose-1,6-bisphosphate aldolase non-catalytic subunit AgaZ/GatZ
MTPLTERPEFMEAAEATRKRLEMILGGDYVSPQITARLCAEAALPALRRLFAAELREAFAHAHLREDVLSGIEIAADFLEHGGGE